MSQRLTRNHYSRTYAGGESSRVREIPIKLDYNTHSNDDDARVRGKSSKTLNGSSYSRNSEARSNNSTPYKDYLKKSENIGTYNSQHDDNDTLERMKAELSTPRIFWDHGIDTENVRERSSSMSRDRRAQSEQKKKSVQIQASPRRQRSASVGGGLRQEIDTSRYNGKDVEEIFKPMWSWYYGENDQNNRNIVKKRKFFLFVKFNIFSFLCRHEKEASQSSRRGQH